jgi:hypothetical protein
MSDSTPMSDSDQAKGNRTGVSLNAFNTDPGQRNEMNGHVSYCHPSTGIIAGSCWTERDCR